MGVFAQVISCLSGGSRTLSAQELRGVRGGGDRERAKGDRCALSIELIHRRISSGPIARPAQADPRESVVEPRHVGLLKRCTQLLCTQPPGRRDTSRGQLIVRAHTLPNTNAHTGYAEPQCPLEGNGCVPLSFTEANTEYKPSAPLGVNTGIYH